MRSSTTIAQLLLELAYVRGTVFDRKYSERRFERTIACFVELRNCDVTTEAPCHRWWGRNRVRIVDWPCIGSDLHS